MNFNLSGLFSSFILQKLILFFSKNKFCFLSLTQKLLSLKTIIVSVTNDISNDQRVSKVCDTLYHLNYTLVLVGRKLSSSVPIQRNYKIKRFKLIFNKGFLFYAEFNIRLFFYLLLSKCDILLSNDLDTLLPNFFVSKLRKKELVYDSHELFTEIPELIDRPNTKRVWEFIEKLSLPRVKNCYTVSYSIAEYYKEKYNTHFEVVRNVPKRTNIKKHIKLPSDLTEKKIILYQGAVNKGRGLELMIKTIRLLNNCIFLIVGDGDILDDLKKLVHQEKLHKKIIFFGKVTPEILKSITPMVHLGLSIEENLGLSYRFALPNKLFDYIQAKIPVITSNLPEMEKVILKYGIGEVLVERTPKVFANLIENVLNTDYSLNLEKAKAELIWEKEEKKLSKFFNHFI